MKIIDQTYCCKMPGQVSGTWQLQCHLRIFRSRSNVHTVMITDMGFEIGWFNPFIIENLVDQVVRAFHLDPAKLVWLEHYAPDYREVSVADYSQVVFEWQNGKATNPRWLAIAPDVAHDLVSEELKRLSA